MQGQLKEVIRTRRTRLGVSQDALAWFANVSRGTIGNLERGTVIPEERTSRMALTVLGLAPKSGDPEPLLWEEFEEILPEPIVARILNIIMRRRLNNPSAADAMVNQYAMFSSTKAKKKRFRGLDRAFLEDFATSISPFLGKGPVDDQIRHLLMDSGWDPLETPIYPDGGDPALRSDMATRDAFAELREEIAELQDVQRSFMQEIRKMPQNVDERYANAFKRLPITLQRLLARGDVGDYELFSPVESPGIHHVMMIIQTSRSHVSALEIYRNLIKAHMATYIGYHIVYALDGKPIDSADLADIVSDAYRKFAPDGVFGGEDEVQEDIFSEEEESDEPS
jgi:DNA-binding XRE family transcriptional regulator